MLFTTKSGRVTGGTQDTLRLVGESNDLDDVVVSGHRTMSRLSSTAWSALVTWLRSWASHPLTQCVEH
jgi:hypothetical protein